MPKKTPWFDGDVKPVRNGVYERAYDDGRNNALCLFKNGMWFCYGETAKDAEETNCISSYQNNIRWRGLTKEAK